MSRPIFYDMVTHMKTTIDLSDALFTEARRVADENHTTLRALIEAGLRTVLASKQQPRTFRLRKASFGGQGLQSQVAGETWERIRELAYEGHGG